MPAEKVIVGLSGGVDSSVSAALLKEAGYAVEGLFMKNWDEDDNTLSCTASADFADAQAVADKLDIPLHFVNFASEYWQRVFERFLVDYRRGLTPNPDVLCNRYIKFDMFWQYAQTLGADKLAMGHYAITRPTQQATDSGGNEVGLYQATDAHKDQTYFLYAIQKAALQQALFPLGGWLKTDVRKKAEALGLATAKKKDSTGICFIGEREMKGFLQRYLPVEQGEMVDTDGRVLGVHDGVWFYTIGQRSGLGLGGVKGAQDDKPWFVARKDIKSNRLVLVQGGMHEALLSTDFSVTQLNFLCDEQALFQRQAKSGALNLHIRTRHGAPLVSAEVRFSTDSSDAQAIDSQTADIQTIGMQTTDIQTMSAQITTRVPQRAMTPGQSVVFYAGARCLGGGVLSAVNA